MDLDNRYHFDKKEEDLNRWDEEHDNKDMREIRQDFNDRFKEKVKDRFNLGDDDVKITEVEPPKKDDTPTKILGFEDLDGDGDPIFDDAILDD